MRILGASRRAGLLVAVLLAAASSDGGASRRPDVPLWNRRGLWYLGSDELTCQRGLVPFRLQQIGALVVQGTMLTAAGEDAGGRIEAELRGRTGRRLKGRISVPACGEGKFQAVMQGDFQTISGAVKFGSERAEFGGVYVTDAEDAYALGLRMAFAAKRAGDGIKPGSHAVLTVFVENGGPQPVPLRTTLFPIADTFTRIVHLSFLVNATPDGPGQTLRVANVPIEQVALLHRLADFETGFTPQPGALFGQLDLPLALQDLLIYAIKMRIPEEFAGMELMVLGNLRDAGGGDLTGAMTSIRVRDNEDTSGLKLVLTLRNKDDQPVHIFLDDDPDPFSTRTRVPAGGSKILRLRAQQGQTLSFGAGRNDSVLDTCTTGAVVKAGRGTIAYDPAEFPPFLALRCPGGY